MYDLELTCRDFCTADPVLWFLHAESAFRDSRVTVSRTKFDFIVMKLPWNIIVSVRGLIRGSAALTTPYEDLRDKLVSSYTHTHKSASCCGTPAGRRLSPPLKPPFLPPPFPPPVINRRPLFTNRRPLVNNHRRSSTSATPREPPTWWQMLFLALLRRQ